MMESKKVSASTNIINRGTGERKKKHFIVKTVTQQPERQKEMDNAKKHWPILEELGTDLENKVQEFMVIGEDGKGLIVATEDGLAYWFGKMRFGIPGNFRTATNPTLLDVSELVSMAQGDGHILLLNKRRKIYSMGVNYYGQLGLGTVDQETHFSPQIITSPHKFTSVRCGYYHNLALTEDGKVWAWGRNNYGQVGLPSSTGFISSPRQISELDHHRVIAVECGSFHSLALTNQGKVYAWGLNGDGQLGGGNELYQQTPTRIITPSPVQSMAAGISHTLLLTQTGEVYACGNNGWGQLGLSCDIESSFSVSKVVKLPLISQIASHPLADLLIAMSLDHRCFVWGHFDSGIFVITPRELDSSYSTVESALSSYSGHRSTPHSVTLPGRECSSRTDSPTRTESSLESVLNHSSTYQILDKMFNNPDSNPDVWFKVGNQIILAHRCVLQCSSAHFRQLFSSSSSSTDLNLPSSDTLQSGASISRHTTNPSKSEADLSRSRHTTNPSKPEPEPDSTPHSPHVTISISDHSYPAFHAYLRFLYLGILEVSPEHLADLFSLSVAYLESDLQQLCLLRMHAD